jgi:hypothetical protein
VSNSSVGTSLHDLGRNIAINTTPQKINKSITKLVIDAVTAAMSMTGSDVLFPKLGIDESLVTMDNIHYLYQSYSNI